MKRRVLIAASGSGGHLMPALYIAEALRELDSEVEVRFIGSGRPLERELIDRRGFKRHELALVGLKNRGLTGLVQFLRLLPKAILELRKVFSEFQPQVVLGVGGYVSVLPVTLAALRRIPTWIHEAELHPGLANNLLRFYASRISVTFPQAELARSPKAVLTGHPVRPELSATTKLDATVLDSTVLDSTVLDSTVLDSTVLDSTVLDSTMLEGAATSAKRLLILGGSQGAKAIDHALVELLPFIKQQGLSVVHQCRSDNVESLSKAYQEAGLDARVSAFIHELAATYAWADIIISRSGAGACAELSIVNKPCILVPYPHAQAGHQLANAKIIVDAGKALLCEEGPDFAPRLQSALQQLLDPVAYKQMQSLPPLQRAQSAAHMIAQGVLDLIRLG